MSWKNVKIHKNRWVKWISLGPSLSYDKYPLLANFVSSVLRPNPSPSIILKQILCITLFYSKISHYASNFTVGKPERCYLIQVTEVSITNKINWPPTPPIWCTKKGTKSLLWSSAQKGAPSEPDHEKISDKLKWRDFVQNCQGLEK